MQLTGAGTCDVCGVEPSAVFCDGCGKKLCVKCRQFEIWSYGCGHGDTKAFCHACYRDPAINLWLQD